MRRLFVEVAAQLVGIAELFVIKQAFRANAAKGSRQLIVMRVAARQPVVVDENPELHLRNAGLSR